MLGERDVVLDKVATDKDITLHIYDTLKKHWKRGYSYIKRKPHLMRSKQVSNSVRNEKFVQYIVYMHDLAEANERHNYKTLPSQSGKELKHWDENGGYCIYLSVLLYGLLTKYNIVSKDEIKYYQGYYDFMLRDDFPSFLPIPKRHIGLHAWITIDGSVIDVTANQNMSFFDFKFESDINIILGKYPNKYRLVGFEETDKTIEEYFKMFSDFSSQSVDEWLEFHHQESIKRYNREG